MGGFAAGFAGGFAGGFVAGATGVFEAEETDGAGTTDLAVLVGVVPAEAWPASPANTRAMPKRASLLDRDNRIKTSPGISNDDSAR
jgi:hypothetical protein